MGAAIAKRFQTEGATVIATGANPETLEKAKKEPWASKATSFLCSPKRKKIFHPRNSAARSAR
ncbi:hypothetical protein [Paraburkholderia sp. D1E]|uniref:hypothetical protein n=1 Tax=Paraburkholderia sp. D1E TaxID=3461398 RepID=UPI0040465662